MRLCYFAIAALGLAGCASANSVHDKSPSDARAVFVSPAGNDSSLGTREAPFRTLSRALEDNTATQIIVTAGEYPESEINVSRRVAILGPEEGGAIFAGHLVIRAN